MRNAHLVQAVSFWLLVLTGLLLLPAPFSELRQVLTGGHSIHVRKAHLGVSIPFIGAALWFGRSILAVPPHRLHRPRLWRRVNRWVATAALLAFSVTGVLLWQPHWSPEAFHPVMRSSHVLFTWFGIAWMAGHGLFESFRWLNHRFDRTSHRRGGHSI